MKQLDSVTGAIVENVDNTIRRIEIIAAYQLGQAKNTLTHVYWSATNPKNICFVEYKHKVFRAKVVKLEAHTKAAKVGCLLFNTGNLNFVYGGKKHGVIIVELH